MENFNEEIKKLFEGVNATFNSKTCIGEPIKVKDTTIVPLVEMTMGAGMGDFSKGNTGKGGGFGAKVSPVACLIIQNGFTKLINIKNQDALTKLLDMLPDVIDKLTGNDVIEEEVQDEIDKLDDEYIENV